MRNVKDSLKFIIGLGNPGRKYSNTPHNIGYEVADTLSGGAVFKKSKNSLYLASRRKDGIVLVKPLTYMNLSGWAVSALLGSYKAYPGDILVVCDDFTLPLGKMRCRPDGSDGGHKGLASIINEIGNNFARFRIGIGPLPAGIDPADFVLKHFDNNDSALILLKNNVTKTAARIIDEEFIPRGNAMSGTWSL